MIMIRRFVKSRPMGIAVLCAALMLQSCNRGVGCPTKFSLFELPGAIINAISGLF